MDNNNPVNPFETLKDYPDLTSLINCILESIEVNEVKVVLPADFDKSLINHPEVLLPVREILIGNATFNYIRYRAQNILAGIQDRIEKINQDKSLSFSDKVTLFKKVKTDILYHCRYFDSMNPIRYMSAYKWKIVYTVEEDGKTVEKIEDYPNSKIDLQEGHWNIIENSFLIRKHLLYEILYLIDEELQMLEEELADTKYSWKENGRYEIYELIVALIAS